MLVSVIISMVLLVCVCGSVFTGWLELRDFPIHSRTLSLSLKKKKNLATITISRIVCFQRCMYQNLSLLWRCFLHVLNLDSLLREVHYWTKHVVNTLLT